MEHENCRCPEDECAHDCGCTGDCECGCCGESPDAEPTAKELLDRYQRCLAEFDNYRKRTVKEMSARYDDGIRAACEKLLPIADNFERAMNACDDKENSFFQGIALIARQLGGVLTELGLEQISVNPGDPFNANFHHAVVHTEDESLGQNSIAEVLQEGYTHKGRVIRYTMVKTAN